MVMKRILIVLTCMVYTSLPIAAHATTLREAVMASFNDKEVFWPLAFYHDPETDNEHLSAERLYAELDNLALRFRINGDNEARAAMLAWQKALMPLKDRRRTVARIDPVVLLAHPRQNVQIDSPVVFGMCQPSGFIEVWNAKGVVRKPWRDDMTSDDIKHDLPTSKGISSQWANVITPDGEIRRLGIAAWNNTSTPLPPGARIVPELSLNIDAARWLNQALPQWLATRWPGDHCQSWTYSPNTTHSNEK